MGRISLAVVLLGLLVVPACAKSPSATIEGRRLSTDNATAEEWSDQWEELARSTPTRLTNASESQGHRIGIGDLLEIAVLEAPEFSRSVRVSDPGDISLPLLGKIRVEGLTPREVEAAIAERLRRSYMLDPQVAVEVKEIRGHQIYVMGEVNRAGAFPLDGRQQVTVLQAVTLGQGLRPMAAKNRTVIIRTMPGGHRVKIPVDIGGVLTGEATDVALQPDDIVFVPTNSTKSIAGGILNVLLRIITFRAIF